MSLKFEENGRPKIGLPFRSTAEQLAGRRGSYEEYVRAIEEAGGEVREISLLLQGEQLRKECELMDALVLPGSPRDVDPVRYGATRQGKTADADAGLERTDVALLDEVFRSGKPLLAICYGIQILNVYLGGTLIQDIGTDRGNAIQHEWIGKRNGTPEPFHQIKIEPESLLGRLHVCREAEVNSSHHQAIKQVGRSLRVSARAPDGVIEGVEWRGSNPGRSGFQWVVGTQWHPERMRGRDPGGEVSRKLFGELVQVARTAQAHR